MADLFVDLTEDVKFQKEQRKREGTPDFLLERLMLRISEQILFELKDKKWTYSEFASRLGVSQPYISKLINGKPNLTIKSLANIAAVLEFNFSDNIFKKEAEDCEMYNKVKMDILKGGKFKYDPELYRQAG